MSASMPISGESTADLGHNKKGCTATLNNDSSTFHLGEVLVFNSELAAQITATQIDDDVNNVVPCNVIKKSRNMTPAA